MTGISPPDVDLVARRVVVALLGTAGRVLPDARRRVAEMKLAHIAALVAAGQPSESILAEGMVFDVVFVLVRDGELPPSLYRLSADVFGQDGLTELIYVVGLQTMVSKAFNGIASRRPGRSTSSPRADPTQGSLR